jgi:hypothetical protein
VKRWLVVAAAVALAALAFVLIVRREPTPGGPPMDQIDAESRARLEKVLREEAKP